MKPNKIESEALHLPVDERAKLAERLLESLDELSEKDAEVLWLREAQRRAREIDEGAVELVAPEELERRVQAHLK
jgi:putative addiction module component (TIGR02574 family)